MTRPVYDTAPNTSVLALLPADAFSVLDVGCGTGQLAKQLKARSVVTDGITHNAQERDVAEESCRKVWLFDLKDGLPEPLSRYDAIILSHVLEHVADPAPLLAALPLALSEGGSVICAIPNMLFLYNRLKLLAGRVEYEQYGLMDYTHVRWYTRRTLIQLFERHGFLLERASSNGYFPLGPLRRILPLRFSRLCDDRLIPMLPGLLAKEFVFRFRMAP